MNAPYSYQLKEDANGRIVEKIETVSGKAIKWLYSYDKEGRLFEAHLGNRRICQCYYDKKGRRIRDCFPATHGVSYRNFHYNELNDRLQSAGNNTYTHNENGFRSIWSQGSKYTTYEYSPDNRLLKATQEWHGTLFEFGHDENGQRNVKYSNGQLVLAYAWLDLGRLAGFHDGQTAYEFAYKENERTPYAMRDSNDNIYALFYDQVGSLRVVADQSGNVIKEVLYDPFGAIIEDTNLGFHIPVGFAGGLHDRDLGFVRFGWRDYDVVTNRWTAPDPMGDAGGDSDWYGYCLDDPVNLVDPLGLMGSRPGSIEENFSWESVLIWRANDGACEACTGMDGTEVPDATSMESMRPHPNCQCTVEVCYDGLELGEWEFVREDTTGYSVVFVINEMAGPAVIAIWNRHYEVEEKRDEKQVRDCPSNGRTTLDERTKYRKREDSERAITGAICWNGGNSISGCDRWLAKNPWTGETEAGDVVPGS